MPAQHEPSKRERRRAETRAALLGTAQSLIAERRTSASIREITAQAGVGFGTFFNYFVDKDELFDTAVRSTLLACAASMEGLLDDVDDPAEAIAAACRLMGRLQRRMPEQIRVLLAHGSMIMVHEEGLAYGFRQALAEGTASGCFDIEDIDRGVMAVLGAMMGVLQLLDIRPDLDDAAEADQFAVRVLLSLGMSREGATEVVARPLPALADVAPSVWVQAGYEHADRLAEMS